MAGVTDLPVYEPDFKSRAQFVSNDVGEPDWRRDQVRLRMTMLHVPCPPDRPGETRSPDRLLEVFKAVDARDGFYGPELSTDFLKFPETFEELEGLEEMRRFHLDGPE